MACVKWRLPRYSPGRDLTLVRGGFLLNIVSQSFDTRTSTLIKQYFSFQLNNVSTSCQFNTILFFLFSQNVKTKKVDGIYLTKLVVRRLLDMLMVGLSSSQCTQYFLLKNQLKKIQVADFPRFRRPTPRDQKQTAFPLFLNYFLMSNFLVRDVTTALLLQSSLLYCYNFQPSFNISNCF